MFVCSSFHSSVGGAVDILAPAIIGGLDSPAWCRIADSKIHRKISRNDRMMDGV